MIKSKPWQPRIFGILLFCLLGVPGQGADTADSYYAKGLGVNNAEVKIKHFSIALKLDPEHHLALLERASAYLRLGKMGAAVGDLETYDKQFPASPGSMVLHGKIAGREGSLDQAVTYYDQALVLDKTHNEANYRKGLHLLTMASLRSDPGLYGMATPHFLQVGEEFPFYKMAQIQAARCQEHQREYSEALEIYESLIKMESKKAVHYFQQGRLYYFSDQGENALKSLEHATRLTFQDRKPQMFYGVFRFYLQKTFLDEETSLAYHLKLFLEKFEDNPLKSLFLGEMDDEAFKAALQQKLEQKGLSAKRAQSTQCEWLTQLGYYYLTRDQNEEAIDCFAKALEKGDFGSYPFYMARFEHQRLTLAREMDLS
jgi:tetratricopeptide (TPR) repeat protein